MNKEVQVDRYISPGLLTFCGELDRGSVLQAGQQGPGFSDRPGVQGWLRTGDLVCRTESCTHLLENTMITAKTPLGFLVAPVLSMVCSKHTAWSENVYRKWVVCLSFWPLNSVLNGSRYCARAGYLGVPS